MPNRLFLSLPLALLAACGAADDAAVPAPTDADGGETAAATVERVHVLDCGTIEISDLDVFADDGSFAGQTDTFADTCYLVSHPDGRTLLWDLGVPGGLAGGEAMVSPPFTVSLNTTLTDQLGAIGATPDFVSISHSHFDHVGQAGAAPDATWLVHEDELAHMKATMADDQTGGFAALMALDTQSFRGEYDVFGDGSAVIVPAPGHTPGHTVLKAVLADETVLLSGDLYHRTESRAGEKVPRFNHDAEATRESMAAFEAMADALGARVIIQHEPDDVASLIGTTLE